MPLESKMILVASDDAALVASLADSLHESGYRVSNALEDSESEEGSNVIVLDTALPAARRADLLSRRAGSPIVALASRDSVRQTAAQEGVWVCLAKPVELDNVLLAVDRITRYAAAA